MQTELLDNILPQAYSQGLLTPTNFENPALVSTVNNANQILYLLAQANGDGMTTAQITHHSGLNENTCRCYLRKLTELGLTKREKLGVEALWLIQ